MIILDSVFLASGDDFGGGRGHDLTIFHIGSGLFDGAIVTLALLEEIIILIRSSGIQIAFLIYAMHHFY